MVLQRAAPIPVWGTAAPRARLTIRLGDESLRTRAETDGSWRVEFPARPAGGPYTLSVESKTETIRREDLLIGDVWFCSGQSNMVWKLGWVQHLQGHMEQFDDAHIRLTEMPHKLARTPQIELAPMTWDILSPESAHKYSAVAVYFAQFLQPEIDVPIGLVVSAWGGTNISPWISARTMAGFPAFAEAMAQIPQLEEIDSLQARIDRRYEQWLDSLERLGPGMAEGWHTPELDDSDWRRVALPGTWDTMGVAQQGTGWFRRTLALHELAPSRPSLITLGPVTNRADVYLNGQLLAQIARDGQRPIYLVPEGVARSGENVLALKLYHFWGSGGIAGTPEQMRWLGLVQERPLAGEWRLKEGLRSRNPSFDFGPNAYPSLIYHAMVHPFTLQPIKGVLWYQGENNTGRTEGYAELLKGLITDWRQAWQQPDLPVLVVQLPNFNHPSPEIIDKFAVIREDQRTATELDGVGLAVTIDQGNPDDIHPQDKTEVGRRLALLARQMVYGDTALLAQSPHPLAVQVKDNQVAIRFGAAGHGLTTPNRYGWVPGFQLGDAQGQWRWVKAEITAPDEVSLQIPEGFLPIRIRYAYENDPEHGLYNPAGLPATPFEWTW